MTDKERLTAIIDTLCLGNKAEFARAVNASPQTVTNWMNRGISKDGLLLIKKAFPDLNRNWLMTGEGEMLTKTYTVDEIEIPTEEQRNKLKEDLEAKRAFLIPLVHIDSVGGVHSPNSLASSEQYVERMVPFPNVRHGDVAIMQSGSSMAPTIPAGAILQIRRVDNWREYFGYGNDFVLWLDDERRITKHVLKYEPDPRNFVVCRSHNPEVADEELPKSMIVEVWKVVNVLINKGW